MTKFHQAFAWSVVATLGLSLMSSTKGQDNVQFQPTGPAAYRNDANWQGPAGAFVPSSQFGERPVIDSGGTAQLDFDMNAQGTPPPTSALGSVSGIQVLDGGLDVQSGGLLESVDFPIEVGAAGNLRVAGTLIGPELQSSGAIRTVGATSNLNINGDFTHNGSFAAELTSAAHGAVNVGGVATLGGSFEANFNGAPTAIGTTFDIVNAASIAGGFDSVAISGASAGEGQLGVLRQVAGGNGSVLQFSLEQHLVLDVNRDTGVFSIRNPASSPITFDLDGYAINSAVGSLDPAGWNSFEVQGDADWRETGVGGTSNTVAELNPESVITLAAGESRAIGSLYAPEFISFGQETEDYKFTYDTPDGGAQGGVVAYTGDKQFNNVVLTIDPATGNAAMQNESPFSVSIDGYTIASKSGSLLPSWNSLDDQDALEGNWLEASPTVHRLSEVMSSSPDTVTRLRNNEGFLLNGLFDSGGSEDVTFEYLVAGGDQVREGAVVYGALPGNVVPPTVGSMVDTDNDGDVDGADFLALQRDDPSLISDWEAAFGTGGATAAAGAVPEPATAALLMLSAFASPGRRRRG